MATVLLSNLAPVKDPEAALFVALIQAFERRGHRCLLWSTAYHPRLAPWFLPSHWAIGDWLSYYPDLAVDGPLVAPAKWLPRCAPLIKQGPPSPEQRLAILSAVARRLRDRVRPDLFVAWNPLCPHTGVLADLCREDGVPVVLLERGMFPQTWFFETGGLLGHSEIARVELEELVPVGERGRCATLGAAYLRTANFEKFNSYAQAPVDLDKLERIEAAFPRRIAFFPPDDGTLGFLPGDHPDRLHSLPGYTDSFAAARALAERTEAAVIFKPHPSFAGRTFDPGGQRNLFVVQTDFRILIDRCDAVASTGSGLAFVALASGKPHLDLATEWLAGKGISYEAPLPEQLAAAARAALSREGLAVRRARFELFVGYLMSEYLVGLPDGPAGHLKPDEAVARLLRRVTPRARAASLDVVALRADLLPPQFAGFLHGQEVVHGPADPGMPAGTATTPEQFAAQLADGPARPVIVDFDHTLLLGNSTELFLAKVRPRWLAFLVALLADEGHRLCTGGRGRYAERRDWVRILAVAVLLPWSLPFWRLQASRVMAGRLNRRLWEMVAGRPVQIASLGFRPVIEPLLRALSPMPPCTASPLWPPGRTLRAIGKTATLESILGRETVAASIAITDAAEDLPLLRAVARPALMKWEEPPPPAPAYLPLRYTAEGKYPGKRILINQHFGEDLAVVLLAYGWGGVEWLAAPVLFLAFFAVYEIGYWENDFVAAAKEAKPVLAPPHQVFAGYRIGWAWLWATLLSAAGLWLLSGDWRWPAALWAGVLLGTRGVFALYNRTGLAGRVWLYPVLQLAKGFAFAPLATLSPAGACLLVAQAMRQVTNYAVYRSGGDTKRFKRQGHRAVVFLLLAVATAAALRSVQAWLTVQTALIAGWVGFRILRERFGPLPALLRKTTAWLGGLLRRPGARPRIIIFGAGVGGELAAAALGLKAEIVAFCDNDPAKRGRFLRGRPIVGPDDLAGYADCEIHLATYYHYHEIYTQLRRLKIPDSRLRFFHLKNP